MISRISKNKFFPGKCSNILMAGLANANERWCDGWNHVPLCPAVPPATSLYFPCPLDPVSHNYIFFIGCLPPIVKFSFRSESRQCRNSCATIYRFLNFISAIHTAQFKLTCVWKLFIKFILILWQRKQKVWAEFSIYLKINIFLPILLPFPRNLNIWKYDEKKSSSLLCSGKNLIYWEFFYISSIKYIKSRLLNVSWS